LATVKLKEVLSYLVHFSKKVGDPSSRTLPLSLLVKAQIAGFYEAIPILQQMNLVNVKIDGIYSTTLIVLLKHSLNLLLRSRFGDGSTQSER